MAELEKVTEGHFRSFEMVEDDVGDAGLCAVSGDRDYRDWDFDLCGRVEQEKAIDGAFDEHAGVLFQQVRTPVVAGGEVEVAGAGQFFDDAAHDPGKVAFAEIWSENAHAHTAALAQRAGEVVRAVVQLLCSVEDALAGLLGDGFCRGRIVQNQRDRRLGELQMLSQHLQVHVTGLTFRVGLWHPSICNRFR